MALVLENSLELNLEYDEEDDVLYAWVGEKPTAAITYETDEGHLVRLDPETKEFVGVTIFDYRAKWDDLPSFSGDNLFTLCLQDLLKSGK